ncbi:UNVERIFIED_CONTAM: Gibberellin 3-beta-dioxygenase 1 [Sesamum angustifolium]|uniref:Gibberellin 3-beta-dioxygenase 1 n=1 Tax=Sesamum angustifolium TaxID=2727405 RepID=A0AAW2MJW3_9LAMI
MATSLSQVFRDTPLHPKHIIPLDFDTVHELPDSHAWIQTDDFSCAYQIRTPTTIPVIDLRAPNVVELMGNACQKWGMFQVTNHDIPSSLVDDVVEHARRLFALPAERKLKALRSPSGATGYGVARISPFFSKLMWHEGFTIMGSAGEHAKQLWPHHYEDFWYYRFLLLLLKYGSR